MALFLGSSQKGTFAGVALSLELSIVFQRVDCFLKNLFMAVPERTNSFPMAGGLSVNRDSKKGRPAKGAPRMQILSEWEGIHESAPSPQIVQPTLKLKGGFRTYVAIKDFAVVAHLLDDVVGPFFIETKSLAKTWGDS